MKVRVKEGMKGFIYDKYQTENTEFNLVEVEHSVKKDENGDPVKISIAQQFSDVWMEAIDDDQPEHEDYETDQPIKPKKRGRPAKVKDES